MPRGVYDRSKSATEKVAKAPKAAKQKREKLASSSDGFADITKLNALTNTLAALNGSTVSGAGNTAKAIFAKIEAIAERIEPTPAAASEGGEEAPKAKRAPKAVAAAPAQATFTPPVNGQATFVPPAAPAA